MSSQLPSMLNRLSSGKRKSHFHFDVGHENQTEAELSLTESILKRQNRQLAEERHESIKKKAKIEDDRQVEQSRAEQSRIRDSLQAQSQEHEIQQKSIQILRELLFHPNRSSKNIINAQLSNQWILSPFSPTKIKSFLMLYMILYQFDQIKFKFTKVINPNPTPKDNKGSRMEKRIGLQAAEYSFISKVQEEALDQRELAEYHRFVENERKKILSEYLEWLVWVNRDKFEREKGNEAFWAMAFNQCEEYSMQLMANKNPATRKRSIFLSMFLMNCQDILFRSTVQIPKEEKMLIFMTQQNLSVLPKCHWLLGLNFAIRYFYRKDLGRRVREALDRMNIDEDEIGQFWQEYDLLSGYFCGEAEHFSEANQKLSGMLMEWLAVEGGATLMISKDRAYRKQLSSRLCRRLLTIGVSDKARRHDMFLTSLQLLQRQSLLSNQQKDQILSQILYKQDPISQNIGVSDLHSIIKRLEQHKETALPKLFARLTQEYDRLYRHWLLSNQVAVKFDVLGQLRHLVEIDVGYLTKELKERIHKLMTSFNLITHWNNEVLKVLVYLIQKYVKNLLKFVDETQNKESPQNMIEEQRKAPQDKSIAQQFWELRSLATFLKLHLKLQPLTILNLCSAMQLVKASSLNQTQVKFQQRTMTFIKRDMLGMVFSRTGLNESLLNEIRKISFSQSQGRALQEKYTEVGFLKRNNMLEELSQMARGVKHFEQEVSLLKEQVKAMESKQQKENK